jgi:hypothetical protein
MLNRANYFQIGRLKTRVFDALNAREMPRVAR